MPALNCPICKKPMPVKWDAKKRQWRFWPHGDPRCAGSGRYLGPGVRA